MELDQKKVILEQIKNREITPEEGLSRIKQLKNSGIPESSFDICPGQTTENDIAVIGISGIFPGSDNVDELWEHLQAGHSFIDQIPARRWRLNGSEEINSGRGGFLSDISAFDAEFFSISEKEAEMMDPRQRLFMEEAWKALEDAGYTESKLDGADCGIFVGCQEGDYFKNYDGTLNPYLPTGISNSILASRMAYYLNLKGPAIAVDTACSSALSAIYMAYSSLLNNSCEIALAGGVQVLSTKAMFEGLNSLGMFSPSGICRAFDNAADGTVIGEAVGVIVLKRLDRAVSDRDQIYGVIKAIELNQDGKTNGITAPNALSQKELEIKTYQKSNINPQSITYVESHGTGTRLGDPIELQALTEAFQQWTDRKNFCAIGSIKPNIGHSMPAAGIASVIKVLCALTHKKLPPLINYHTINSNIDLAQSPFYILTEAKDWNVESGIRRAAVSSFGFSGTNCHMIIEEYPCQNEDRQEVVQDQLIFLSGKTKTALKNKAADLIRWLEKRPECRIQDLSYTLCERRSHFKYRWYCTASTIAELQTELSLFIEAGRQGDQRLKATDESLAELLRQLSSQSEQTVDRRELLERIGTHYVNGESGEWGLVFQQDANTISLPPYPFSRKSYWHSAAPASVTDKSICEMSYRRLSKEGTSHLIVSLTGKEFFVTDHVVDDLHILPGAAQIEMARAAGEQLDFNVCRISNIVWQQPIVAESELFLSIAVEQEDDGIKYRIESDSDNPLAVYSQGWLYGSHKTPLITGKEQINIHDIIARSQHKLTGTECYQITSKYNFKYGKGFQPIQELYINSREVLSRLKLPDCVPNELGRLKLHPTLIDGAFQTALGFADNAENHSNVPFILEDVEIYHPLVKECYVYAQLLSDQNKGAAKLNKYRMTITDLTGKILVVLNNFIVKELKQTGLPKHLKTDQKPAENMYLDSIWLSAPAAVPGGTPTDTLSRWLAADEGGTGQSCLFRYTKENAQLSDIVINLPEQNQESFWKDFLNRQSAAGWRLEAVLYGFTEEKYRLDPVSADKQLDCYIYPFFDLIRMLSGMKWESSVTVLALAKQAGSPLFDALRGLGAALFQENRKIILKTVILEGSSQDRINQVTTELTQHDGFAVKYQQDIRKILSLRRADPPENEHRKIRKNGIYIITGGTGGIGEILSEHLASRYGCKLVLFGRSRRSDRVDRQLEKIRALGGEGIYLSGDVCSQEDVSQLISSTLQQFKKIDGLFHCAGIINDDYFYKKQNSQIQQIVRPKILGTLVLYQELLKTEAELFMMFSSIAAVFGNAGQCDYAYGNAFMDSFAELAVAEKQLKIISVNWPMWEEGGMQADDESVKLTENLYGMIPIPVQKALEAFEYSVNKSEQIRVILTYGGVEKIEQILNLCEENDEGSFISQEEVDDMQMAQKNGSHEGVLLEDLMKIAGKLIKGTEGDMSPDDDIEECGFDSIAITAYCNELNQQLSIKLTPLAFFELEQPTIRALQQYLLKEYSEPIQEYYKLRMEEAVYQSPPSQQNQSLIVPVAETDQKVSGTRDDIAIIGIAGTMPQSDSVKEFWNNLEKEKDLITEIPQDRRKSMPDLKAAGYGGFMKTIDTFDAEFFNISPREANYMDPQQRIMLEMTWKVIEDAGYNPKQLAGTKTGVFIAVSGSDYFDLMMRNQFQMDASSSMGTLTSIFANRISFLYDFHGPSESIDTACSSSLVALHHAVEAIHAGLCDTAIVGGINVILTATLFNIFDASGMLCKDGKCKTFDADADGYVRGEGAGAVYLKSLSKAQADKDDIYGVIRSTSVNHGGRAKSLTSPNTNAQADLIFDSIIKSGVDPATVTYIEAHGTGTNLGDPVEIKGLKKAFQKLYQESGKEFKGKPYCGVGSVKTNIGHLEAASGIASLLKIILSIKNNRLPASLHMKMLNPLIDLEDSPFYIVNKTIPWVRLMDEQGNETPRRAGISSFGYGGANAHTVIEEYVTNQEQGENRKPQLILLSSRTRPQLRESAAALACYIRSPDQPVLRLDRLAYTLAAGREHMQERLAVVAADPADLLQKLEQFLDGSTDTWDDRQMAMLQIKTDGCSLVEHARNYLAGAAPDIPVLYPDGYPGRMHVPGYSFTKQRYWFDDDHRNSHVLLKPTDKPALTEINRADNLPVPIQERQTNQRPSTDMINDLKQMLADVLYRESSDIDPVKPFMEQGLDSILGVEFVKLLKDRYQVGLRASSLYNYPSLQDLAAYLQEQTSDSIMTKKEMPPPERESESVSLMKSGTAMRIEPEPVTHIEQPGYTDIAVIGIGMRYPEADDMDEFWENLIAGKDCITEIPKERWDIQAYYDPNLNQPGKSISKWGGFIRDYDKFDPLFFNLSPADAQLLDPHHRIFLQEAWHALEDAGYPATRLNAMKCGVYAGVMNSRDYPGSIFNDSSMLAARIAYFLNLKGPAVSINTACSSSLVAVDLACKALQNNEVDLMLAGGVALYMSQESYLGMSKSGMLSGTGRCRTFDDQADGFVPGEGAGVLVLKRLDKALADQDHIYGVIKGTGINQDGKTNGITAPSAQAQTALEKEVYLKSGINPETISYVECHGTGTKLGDPIEVEALIDSFRTFTDKKSFCRIGSVKSNIGHTSAASGVAGIIKVLLSLKNNQLPPSLHFNKLNEHIQLDESPFIVNHTLTPWTREGTGLRRAAVSSFGFSGTNAHLVLEEAPVRTASDCRKTLPLYAITLSAKSPESLTGQIQKLYSWLNHNKGKFWIGDLAYTLNTRRTVFDYRFAVLASGEEDLTELIGGYLSGRKPVPELIFTKMADSIPKHLSKQTIQYIFQRIHQLETDSSEYRELLQALAEFYGAGAELNWEELYGAHDYQVIPVITYAFKKDRYWYEQPAVPEKPNNSGSHMDNLLHSGFQKLNDCCCRVNLTGREFFFEDNVVYDKPILPGVAYLEMIRAAAQEMLKLSVAVITDVYWLAPIQPDGNLIRLEIEFSDGDKTSLFRLYTVRQHEAKILNMKGSISKEPVSATAVIQDIAAIKKRCNNQTSGLECYQSFRKRQFFVGPSMQAMKHMYYNDMEALSELSLPLNGYELKAFGLHPALMDAALQTITGLQVNSDRDSIGRPYLTFSLERMEILKPLAAHCYVHASLSKTNDLDKPMRHFNINMIDDDGNILVRLINFCIKQPMEENHLNADTRKPVQIIEEKSVKAEDVTRIISSLLKISQDEIDPNEELLNYGFTSISMIGFIETVNREFGINTSTEMFFDEDMVSINTIYRSLERHLKPKAGGESVQDADLMQIYHKAEETILQMASDLPMTDQNGYNSEAVRTLVQRIALKYNIQAVPEDVTASSSFSAFIKKLVQDNAGIFCNMLND